MVNIGLFINSCGPTMNKYLKYNVVRDRLISIFFGLYVHFHKISMSIKHILRSNQCRSNILRPKAAYNIILFYIREINIRVTGYKNKLP